MDGIGHVGRDLRDFLGAFVGSLESEIERRNAETLGQLYERFNQNNVDGMADLLTADYESIDVAAGETTRGPGAYLERQRSNRAAMPDAQTEIRHLIVRGDVAIAEVVNRGTNTGPFELPGGVQLPPTGRKVDALSCEIYRFRAGRIAQGRLYYDFLTVARQLDLPL